MENKIEAKNLDLYYGEKHALKNVRSLADPDDAACEDESHDARDDHKRPVVHDFHGSKRVTEENGLREHNAFARLHDRPRMDLHHDSNGEDGVPEETHDKPRDVA